MSAEVRRRGEAAFCAARMVDGEPGRGLYRGDRVAALGELILAAVQLMALPHNGDRRATAAALRRLADRVEGGGT